jgi:hypothetical protein
MKKSELIRKIELEDILLNYKNNKFDIIHDIRICFNYNIKINDIEIVAPFTYKDNIFYFLYDETFKFKKVYCIDEYINKFIYSMKYKEIKVIGNATWELKI